MPSTKRHRSVDLPFCFYFMFSCLIRKIMLIFQISGIDVNVKISVAFFFPDYQKKEATLILAFTSTFLNV